MQIGPLEIFGSNCLANKFLQKTVSRKRRGTSQLKIRDAGLVLPSKTSTRRKGQSFYSLNPNEENANPRDIDEIEVQALNACATYLVNYPMKSIQAMKMKTHGTKASIWDYIANGRYLTPVFGSDTVSEASGYIEARSANATVLRKALKDIKVALSRPNAASVAGFYQSKSSRCKLVHQFEFSFTACNSYFLYS